MQLTLSPELESFREEVRAFLKDNLPPELAGRAQRGSSPPDHDGLTWQRILNKRGWGVPHWPVEYGGTGWDAFQQFIFEDECHKHHTPVPCWQSVHMVGPVIYTFGSPEQKEKFLPLCSSGEMLWAQGFSEPGSGSDLASLRTRAVLEGDHYIVNGQKIWTSGAFHAQWGFFLVRTDPDVKPQQGISFLLIDLSTPGLTIRRIPTINGDDHLCEVFLDNVKVPAINLIGQPGQGWSYAKFLLDHERTASSFIYRNKQELQRAKDIARMERLDGVPLIELPQYRDRILKLQAELLALEWSVLRVLANEQFKYDLSAVCSGLKVRGSLMQQAITELQMDLLGRHALRWYDYEPTEQGEVAPDEAWPELVQGRVATYLSFRAATIYGGALQVQKNIIAKLAFGL